MPDIAGVLPIVHTPFLEDDSIDAVSLKRQIDWAFEVGADGLATGMVSELLRLSVDERKQLTALIAKARGDRGVMIIGVGAESTRQAVEFALHAQEHKADAVMAIPPISTALAESEMLDYFVTLVESISIPVIVQDASSYVGQRISLDVCAELVEKFGAERVMFKPEAAPLGPNLSALRDQTNGQAHIFEGSGGISLIDSFRRGIHGTMPGMEFLQAVVGVWNALKSGDEQTAYRLYFPLCALVAIQLQAGLDGFLAIEKYVLKKRGLFATDRRRGPLKWKLDKETQLEIDRLLAIMEAELTIQC